MSSSPVTSVFMFVTQIFAGLVQKSGRGKKNVLISYYCKFPLNFKSVVFMNRQDGIRTVL